MKREEYLQKIGEQIRFEKAREGVKAELEWHIEDQKEEFLCAGMTEAEAEEAAVREMGDPVAVGTELDRIHRPRMAWNCIILIGVLYLAGLLLQRLLGAQTESSFYGGGVLTYAAKLLFGFGVMLLICYVDYSRIARWIRQIWAALFLVLTLGACVFGTPVNGANFWIYGALNVKLLVFLFVPLYGGLIFWYRGRGRRGLSCVLLWGLLPAVVCILIRSFATAVLLAVLMLVLLSLAVYRGWFERKGRKLLLMSWGAFLALIASFFLVCWNMGGYRAERIRAILHPYSTEAGERLEILREIALSSQFAGSSPWAGRVPDYGDGYSFMFSHITARYGILAVLLLAGTILGLFLYFLRNVLRQRNQLGMIMGSGCVLVLMAQTILYILTNGGLILHGYNYCPFLTYGGTGVMVTNILLGILLSIYRYENIPLVMAVQPAPFGKAH